MNFPRKLWVILCGLALTGIGWGAAPETLSVAAAADLRFALDEVVREFQKVHTNITVQVSYGSSGNFHAQLTQGAPFDLFFSADVSYPARLVAGGLAKKETQFSYGIGRVVLWVPAQSAIDVARLGIESLNHGSVRRIAIANPEHAPYGQAALAALKKLGVYEKVRNRLIFGESVAQAAQFVDTGSAEIGVIALSLATAPSMAGKGRMWEIPADAHPRLEQGGVILSATHHPQAAAALRAFVLGESGRSVLKRYGFSMPVE